jgi:hypothetical protein
MKTMKRYAFCMVALAVLAVTSCTKETEVKVLEAGKQIEFNAVWADSDATRTVLQSDGTSVWWTPGEEINAFYGNKFSGKFTSTNTSNQALVSFQGTLTVMTGTAEAGNEASSYWAVYPYDAANTCDGQSVTLTVPAVQYGVQGSFADKMFPAVATSKSLDLAFYNVCGGVRFSVSQTGIASVTLKANGNEPLVGKARVGFGADGVPEVMGITEGKSEVVVYAPDGGFIPGEYYFAAFLPQTLSQGLSMAFKTASTLATYSTGSNITVSRSRFGKLDEKDKDLSFVPRPDVPVESVSLDKMSVDVAVGKQVTLTATIIPENATDKSVIWASSDEAIVSVSSTGVVTGVAIGSASITVRTVEGGKTATCSVFVKKVIVSEAIDLGLPSGVKWASFNLGASRPEEYGDYYAWGEIEPYYSSLSPLVWKPGKTGYSWITYKWGHNNEEMIKYCFADGKFFLDSEDDAAYMALEGNWRMPTDAEWTELRENCTWTWTTQNGITGRLVTGNNGNSIFLPASGYRESGHFFAGPTVGYYWSSSLSTSDTSTAWGVKFNSYSVSGYSASRFFGYTVRPVSE